MGFVSPSELSPFLQSKFETIFWMIFEDVLPKTRSNISFSSDDELHRGPMRDYFTEFNYENRYKYYYSNFINPGYYYDSRFQPRSMREVKYLAEITLSVWNQYVHFKRSDFLPKLPSRLLDYALPVSNEIWPELFIQNSTAYLNHLHETMINPARRLVIRRKEEVSTSKESEDNKAKQDQGDNATKGVNLFVSYGNLIWQYFYYAT